MESPSRLKRVQRLREPGAPTNWEKVVAAVEALGRPVSRAEIEAFVVHNDPGFVRKNLGPDLSAVSVNSRSRGHYDVNVVPRRTDSGNRYDRLFRIGSGRGVMFTLYEPKTHGVWELRDIGDKVLRPQLVEDRAEHELREARESAEQDSSFDPMPDERARMLAAIVRREGQPAFRRALLNAYRGQCVVSGCNIEALLEAAHIVPYRGPHTNGLGNGLLLRADLHKLFDLHLLRVDPETRVVHLHESLMKSDYAIWHGSRLRDPELHSASPLRDALLHHWTRHFSA